MRIVSVLLIIIINLYPYVRRLLPQRDEDWLFQITSKHQNIARLIRTTLDRYNPYFNELSHAAKEKFIKRVLYIIVRKTLVGYHDLKVTPEMAIIIFGAQVQLTFGLKKFSMPEFKKIIVYPQQFYSRYFGQDVKGLTSKTGFVTLSWKDSLEGILDPKDNLNLLLHEFAHALMLGLSISKKNDAHFQTQYNEYAELAAELFEIKKAEHANGEGYLRSYGFVNKSEFFAVCIEHFFETPEIFKEKMPRMYIELCELLNQDPLNTKNDYQLQ